MPIEIPTIETARFVLRAHAVRDYRAAVRMWEDPAITRFIGGKAFTASETWGRLLRYAGLWSLLGYGYWAIADRQTDAFIGDVGFADFKRGIDPAFAGQPEMGWVIAPQYHGRGYATEATAAALAWIDRQSHIARSICLIEPANHASIRVAVKNNFLPSDRITYHGSAVLVFRRSARRAEDHAALGESPAR